MPLHTLSLRELKKAKSKIAIYEASLHLMQGRMFHEVMVDCRLAEVSRVTFFKFFPKKEDVLLYFMRIWLTQAAIEVEEAQKSGFSAVRHLFAKLVREAEERSGLMSSLIAFLAGRRMHLEMQDMAEAEVHLLFPAHIEQGSVKPNMYELFTRWMIEARQEGGLKPHLSIEDAVQVLFTIFYGAFLTAQQYQAVDLEGIYNMHLQLLEEPAAQ